MKSLRCSLGRSVVEGTCLNHQTVFICHCRFARARAHSPPYPPGARASARPPGSLARAHNGARFSEDSRRTTSVQHHAHASPNRFNGESSKNAFAPVGYKLATEGALWRRGRRNAAGAYRPTLPPSLVNGGQRTHRDH